MDPLLLIKCLLFLIVFILLSYLCFLLAKKYLILKGDPHNQLITVLAHKCINDKLSITIIAIKNERIMIAAGSQGINLTKLDHSLIENPMPNVFEQRQFLDIDKK